MGLALVTEKLVFLKWLSACLLKNKLIQIKKEMSECKDEGS